MERCDEEILVLRGKVRRVFAMQMRALFHKLLWPRLGATSASFSPHAPNRPTCCFSLGIASNSKHISIKFLNPISVIIEKTGSVSRKVITGHKQAGKNA
jgi:hypothetical protein